MLSPECSQFSFGPPLISVEALFELRDLFASLPLHADCDRASLHAIPKEEAIDERSAKPLSLQMNLPLSNVPPTGNPEDQSEDLTVALMELLIGAAEEQHEPAESGGEDESQAHA